MRKAKISTVCLTLATFLVCGWTVWSFSAQRTNVKAPSRPQSVSGQIATLERRIKQLEDAENMPARISGEAGSSVGLIVGEYIWTDRAGRKPLRYRGLDDNGNPLQDRNGKELVTFDGDGPVIRRDFESTGFLVDSTHLVTSGFILAPWYADPLLDTSENPELIPSIEMIHVYFPGLPKPSNLKIDRAAESQDTVVCSLERAISLTGLTISDSESLSTGEPIVLLGYPGGVDMLVSRVADDVRREIYKYGRSNIDETAQLLAQKGYIRPIAIQSRVSGTTENRVFFETFANYGSTGGPILNSHGAVIALNQSVNADYPSFNMAVTVAPMRSWIADREGVRQSAVIKAIP